ncbi:MAG: TIM barrel protein [Blastocatellia bacterium]
MDRRDFLSSSVLAGAGALASEAVAAPPAQAKTKFKLKYAPHFGMFKHHAGPDLFDQLKFMADQGFTALEDNSMPDRPVEVQEKIGKTIDRLGITMGVFVATKDFKNPTFALNKDDVREAYLKDMRNAVDVAKRCNAKWCTVVPGCFDLRLDWDYQTANVIDNLRRCVDIVAPSGLVMVLEPLNTRRDHPGLFLSKISQGYALCRAVNSPHCKILYDMYHQQITEGNIIPNIDAAWSEVPYFQIGDNPGRREPTTGEMNYKNIFRHIHRKGYNGVMGMEHGNFTDGKEGELAVIRAYQECDSF